MRITSDMGDRAVLEELGARLQRTRLERNLSQGALAEAAGVGRVTVQRIEAGRSASLVSLIRLLRALGLLDGLDLLVPAPAPSPIDELRRRGRLRRRAGPPREGGETEPGPHPWRWGDERAEGNG